ncbi:MAG: acyltransferase, partial [Leptospiraceae bacterium]|nr:acyltransferase [Leptospiraceae bacterium]
MDGFAFWRNLERSNALTNKALDYRPEIDGLRALAVLPVILFHAGFEMFSGGFVGVDVFFVISGYLITTIILSDLEQGKFSIIDFYERRARRILPALFVVMLVSIPFAWFWFLPSDMKFYSRSLVAVSMFASNFLFWRETGYFDTSAEIKPLLHTWSLAVEEQYYVIFPLFLMLFWRFGKRRIFILLLIVFVASFVSAQLGASSRPAATFFLLPTRGWELLIGAFTAFYLYRSNRVEFSGWFREIGSWLGVALIFFSVFAYSEATPFPGIYALVPTVGTMLIILFATQSTTTGRFLGNKYFVGIGLISYSAYLWHQPLFAFARQRSLVEPGHQVFAILSVTSLILAYFSWRYIETPFRKKGYIRRSKIFAYAFCLTVFFIGVGLVGHITEGVFCRQNIANTMQLDARVAANHGLSADCAGGYIESSNCMTDKNPEVLVWGNSYAMHLVQGLIASNPKIKLVQKTISVCGPIFDIAPINAKY